MTTFRIVNHGGTEQYDFDDATTGLLADHASYIEYPLEGQWSVITVELFGDDDWRSKAIDLRAVLNSAEIGAMYPNAGGISHYLEVDGGSLSSTTRRVIRAGTLTLIIETPGNNARYLLTLEVGPREATTATTSGGGSPPVWGGSYGLEAVENGDMPGRIESLGINFPATGSTISAAYERLWVGIKPDIFDTDLAGFDARLYAADMTPGADGTAGGTGGTAYIDVQPTDRTDKALATGNIIDAGSLAGITANVGDMQGRYRALLVYGVDSTALVMNVYFEVYSGTAATAVRSAGAYIQHASGTPTLAEFNTVDLGEVDIAVPKFTASPGYDAKGPAFRIMGRCVAGTLSSAQMRIFRVILLPIDGGALYVDWETAVGNQSNAWQVSIGQHPAEVVPVASGYFVVDPATTFIIKSPELYGNWGMPYNGAKIVLCTGGAPMTSDYDSGTPTLSDSVATTFSYWPRFRNYKA